MEAELRDLDPEERNDFLEALGVTDGGLKLLVSPHSFLGFNSRFSLLVLKQSTIRFLFRGSEYVL